MVYLKAAFLMVLLVAMWGCDRSDPTFRTEIQYWPNGHIQAIKMYDSGGVEHGEWITFSEGGNITGRTKYIRGKTAVVEGFHSNGQMAYHEPFNNGVAEGEWIWWDKSGKELRRSTFSAGSGIEYGFDEDGNSILTREWKNGKLLR